MEKRPLVLGVTGLPCSGKSHIVRLLASGKVVSVPVLTIKADDLGHAMLKRRRTAVEIAAEFGPEVLDEDGFVDRAKVASVVFADAGKLAWLEAFLHPLIDREAVRLIDEADGGVVVLEAALLFAGHMERHCDLVLLIEAEREIRLERAAERGWNEGELSRREARQLPLFAKEKLAAYEAGVIIIKNNANDSDDDLIAQLRNALAAAENERKRQ